MVCCAWPRFTEGLDDVDIALGPWHMASYRADMWRAKACDACNQMYCS